ncbi:hypothetical protein EV360DRAFT_84600 [Lentinula raphanica]|nr:hypothetical protein EV360DRAFT_84600 [Lentinula raphanica]
MHFLSRTRKILRRTAFMVFLLSALALAVSTDSVSYPNEPTKSLSIATSQALVLRADIFPGTVRAECRLLAEYHYKFQEKLRVRETIERMLNSEHVLTHLRLVISNPNLERVTVDELKLYYMTRFPPLPRESPSGTTRVDYLCFLEFSPPSNNPRRVPKVELWNFFRLNSFKSHFEEDPNRGALGWYKLTGSTGSHHDMEYWVDADKGQIIDVGHDIQNAWLKDRSIFELVYNNLRPFGHGKGQENPDLRLPGPNPLANKIIAGLQCVQHTMSVVDTIEEKMLNSPSVLQRLRDSFSKQELDGVKVAFTEEWRPKDQIKKVVSYEHQAGIYEDFYCRIDLVSEPGLGVRMIELYATVRLTGSPVKVLSKGEVGRYDSSKGSTETWAKFEDGKEVPVPKGFWPKMFPNGFWPKMFG